MICYAFDDVLAHFKISGFEDVQQFQNMGFGWFNKDGNAFGVYDR
jgi:hypothetical protein